MNYAKQQSPALGIRGPRARSKSQGHQDQCHLEVPGPNNKQFRYELCNLYRQKKLES